MTDRGSGMPAVSQSHVARRFGPLPAWLLSTLLHATLLVVLGMTLKLAPPGAASEPSREVGVVIKHRSPEGEYYESAPVEASSVAEARTTAPAELFSEGPPVDLSQALPAAAAPVGLGAAEAGQLTGAAGMTSGSGPATAITGGKGRTGVYGIEGEGYKFVYVFDRSGSMGSGPRSPLASAKAELLRSLESLEATHQFQIIFYNEDPLIMNITGQSGRLVFGDERNKQLARQWVGGVLADGGTEHLAALELALRLNPDVIFFLTDADQPELTPGQLLRIQRLNGGRTAINAIEFGLGPALRRENFLVTLARQNGGQYVYVDVSRR